MIDYRAFDVDCLFDEPFIVDKNLISRIETLREVLEKKYRSTVSLIIIQGARTDTSNLEYYQKKYGDDWKKFYNARSLHVVKEDTGNILRAADIGFVLPNGERISGQIIYRAIQEIALFSNVGIADTYVHVDCLLRSWKYQ
jgi:hypothetical protein